MRILDVAIAIALLLLALSLAERIVNREHESAPTEAQRAAQHCATLDAIAVRTPDGWSCITTAVIAAEEER